MTTRAAKSPPGPERAFAPLGVVGLAGAGLIALDQAFQVALSLEGGRGGAAWRFQLATSAAARVVPVVLAVLAAWGALRVRRTGSGPGLLAVLAAAMGALLGLGGVLLWFDGQAIKPGLPADELAPFVAQWLRGLVFSGIGAGFLCWLAWAVRKPLS